MTDLIKRDDALDILCKSCGITEDVENCRKTSADGWCKEYCELKNMPAVDAEPIVRCKDCINRYSICPMITFHYSSGAISTITYRAQDDWWCCFGKRKEE